MREDEFNEKINLNVDSNPLQLPGRHERLRVARIGGNDGVDRRMIFTGSELSRLLDMCNESLSGRVFLEGIGIECHLYRDDKGHQYEVWKLTAGNVTPEKNPWFNTKG